LLTHLLHLLLLPRSTLQQVLIHLLLQILQQELQQAPRRCQAGVLRNQTGVLMPHYLLQELQQAVSCSWVVVPCLSLVATVPQHRSVAAMAGAAEAAAALQGSRSAQQGTLLMQQQQKLELLLL
jgi:hypothetical protein